MIHYTKLFISLCFFTCMSLQGVAQHAADSTQKKEIFTIVDQMPEFEGDLSDYLYRHLQYPASAVDQGQQGTVNVKFIVDKTGAVTDAEVTKSSGVSSLDAEALRVVNALPAFKPGKQNGKAVSVYYTLPVKFTLSDKIEFVPPVVTEEDMPAYYDSMASEPPPVMQVDVLELNTPIEQYYDAPVETEAAPATEETYETSGHENFIPTLNIKDLKIEAQPDKSAAYTTGMIELFKDVNREVRYPYNYGDNDRKGYVIIKFVVKADGMISNAEVIKSMGSSFDNAALSVLRSLRYGWDPAMKKGKAVSSYFYLPVRFQYKKQTWEE